MGFFQFHLILFIINCLSHFQNIVRGYLDTKMRNARIAERKRQRNSSIGGLNNVTCENVSVFESSATDESGKNDVDFLKTVLVNEANMHVIKSKLQSTLSIRFEMMKTAELDLKETFPYFFTHSQLVRVTDNPITVPILVSIHINSKFTDFARFFAPLQRNRQQRVSRFVAGL